MKRNLNEERFGDLTETRTCKICQNNKLLKEFQYHSATNYFSKTCQECINEEKRKKFAEKAKAEGRELNLTHTLERRKVCTKCGEEKDLKTEFTKRGKAYANICRVCLHEILEVKPRLEYAGNISNKICNICKVEKEESEFGKYVSRHGTVSLKYCCKECDSQKERVNDKVSRIYTQYKHSDTLKGIEFSLTKEFIKDSLEKSCTYCGYESTGLDRLENNIGHIESNCVPCCHHCNLTRNNLYSHEEMLLLGKTIKEIKDKRNST